MLGGADHDARQKFTAIPRHIRRMQRLCFSCLLATALFCSGHVTGPVHASAEDDATVIVEHYYSTEYRSSQRGLLSGIVSETYRRAIRDLGGAVTDNQMLLDALADEAFVPFEAHIRSLLHQILLRTYSARDLEQIATCLDSDEAAVKGSDPAPTSSTDECDRLHSAGTITAVGILFVMTPLVAVSEIDFPTEYADPHLLDLIDRPGIMRFPNRLVRRDAIATVQDRIRLR